MKTHQMICTVALLSLVMPTLAEKEARELEEVVVTAEKRESVVNDTPIAISAFSADLMDDLGITTAADIANYTPGMTYMDDPNRIFIRGIGRVENSLGSEPGVAIYRDGIYTTEASSISDHSFFVDRIEVLRGPQGTLYGRNAIGGAANVVSKRPTDTFKGEFRLGAYSYGGQQLGLSASGPVTGRIRYRVALEQAKNDGWVENIAGGDQNDLDFTRWEVQLDIDITDNLNIWLLYNDYEWDQNRGGEVMISPYNTTSPGGPVGDFSNDFQQLAPNAQLGYTKDNPGANDIHKVNKDFTGFITNVGDQFTTHVTYDAEKWSLKYIYGTNGYKWAKQSDNDQTDRTDIQTIELIGQNQDYYQHELQLISNLGDNFEYVFGLFSYHDENWQPYTLYSPTNPVLKTPVWADFSGTVCGCIVDSPANPLGIYYDQAGSLDTDSVAVYGQVDFYPRDQWHVSVGLRHSKDEKDAYEDQRIIFDGQGTYAFIANLFGLSWFNAATPTPGPQARIAWDFTNGPVAMNYNKEWDNTSWSLGVDYTPDTDSLYYAKLSTGYKSGGFRLGSLQPNPDVDEETVLAMEFGAKRTFNNNLHINFAGYIYDYDNMQVPVNSINNGVNTLLFQNAKEASQWGLEFDAQWLASANFMLYATYTYMNTEIKTMGKEVFDTTEPVPVGSDLSGNELIKSPPHKFTVNGHYTWYVDNAELGFVTSYVFTDNQYSSIFNRANTEVPSFSRTDFRLNYNRLDSDLRISLYVRNAFDEDIIESIKRSSHFFNQQLKASIQPPRTVGVEVNFAF